MYVLKEDPQNFMNASEAKLIHSKRKTQSMLDKRRKRKKKQLTQSFVDVTSI